jgi:hypothetical protein
LFRTQKSSIQRQQTKWVVYSVTLAVFGYAVAYAPRVFFPDVRESGAPGLAYNLLALPFFYISVLMIPFAMTFSILRYRLWDIDRLIGRTLIYGLASAALVLIYVGAILVLQQLIRIVTGQGSVVVTVLSTIGVALLAAPLRNRIQAVVDQRFFRTKYDAQQAVEAFARTARETVDLTELTERLTDVVETTLHPSHTSVWIRSRTSNAAGPADSAR